MVPRNSGKVVTSIEAFGCECIADGVGISEGHQLGSLQCLMFHACSSFLSCLPTPMQNIVANVFSKSQQMLEGR